MTVRGSIIGALALGVGPRRPLDDDTVDLAMELAGRAALGFDNARLFRRQRVIADTLQRSLMPTELPALEWLDLAGRSWVPGSGIDVGGDFYDVIEDGEDVVLVIGDVSGKGVDAAALTALARHTLRAAIVHLRELVAAISWLHDGIRAQEPEKFVTAAVIRLRQTDDGVRGEAVVAGHPPPVLVRASGATELINPPGSPPGLPFWERAETATFTLYPGDSLLLYTDGMTDVQGEAALSTEQVCGLATSLAGRSADQFATAVGAALERLRPWALRSDDVAVVVARVESRSRF
jgi:serine phosphatase RsbU (regulator of sigma subunit)